MKIYKLLKILYVNKSVSSVVRNLHGSRVYVYLEAMFTF